MLHDALLHRSSRISNILNILRVMGAPIKVIFLHSGFLCALFFNNIGADDANSNPCSNFTCADGSLCWNEGGKGSCENPCNSTQCEEGHYCVTEIGPCGNSSCRPTGRCSNRTNTTMFDVICNNVTCPNDTKCTIVMPVFPTGPVPMAICGPNPCLEHECCRDAVEEVCEKNACYLRRVPGASIKDIRLEPWCVNPCLLHDLQCEEPGEFCYTNRVVNCTTPPCNPVPVCRKPCGGADPEAICGRGLKCEVVPASCPEDEDPSFSFWGDCQPTERCVSESETKNTIV